MSTKTASAPSNVASTKVVEIRGTRFTFRELEIGEYDDLVKKAAHEEADEDGVMQEVVDNALLMRLMILKCCVEPKLNADSLNGYGTRIYRAFGRIVNELHFDSEPIVVINADETPAEETPKGNE